MNGGRDGAGLAAVVLAGGESRRMGTPKPLLDWHGATLIERVTGILVRVAEPVVVVGGPGRPLPELAPGVEQAADRLPGQGPLAGIAAGLRHVAGRRAAAFVCAADLPLLHPRFVLALAAALDDGADAVVPVWEGRDQPLAAVYRVSLLDRAERLLAAGERRARALADGAAVRRLAASELPEPDSLHNLNTPQEYAAALAQPQPPVTIEADGRTHHVRAATIGAAAEALPQLRTALSRSRVTLNGLPPTAGAGTPLVAGDRLAVRDP